MGLFIVLVPQVDEEKSNGAYRTCYANQNIHEHDRATSAEADECHEDVEHEAAECEVEEVEPYPGTRFVQFDQHDHHCEH